MPMTHPSAENEWQLPHTGRFARTTGGCVADATVPIRHAMRDGSLTASMNGKGTSR